MAKLLEFESERVSLGRRLEGNPINRKNLIPDRGQRKQTFYILQKLYAEKAAVATSETKTYLINTAPVSYCDFRG